MSVQLEGKDCCLYQLNINTKCPWIDKILFKELIERDNSNKNVKVKMYFLQPAVPKGQNYASEVIRARVIYSTESVSRKEMNFILKIKKSDVDVSFKHSEIFLREIAVFRNILPRAEALLRSINDKTKLSAKCYEANSDKYYLIFEDLLASGYRNHDKKIGITFEYFKPVLSTLAKWHATTAVLFDSEPSIMATFRSPFCTEYQDILCQSIIKAVGEFARSIPTLEDVSTKIENISSSILVKVDRSLKVCPSDFNCLNHQDLWTNNIMFNDITGAGVLIDFQLAYLGSPAIDISKLFFHSSHNDIRKKDLDDLLLHYHKELSLTLMKLRFKNIPSLNHLEEQLKIRGVCSMTTALFGTVNRYLEDVNVVYGKLFAPNSDKTINLEIFQNPEAQEKLKFLIKHFNDLGYFDL